MIRQDRRQRRNATTVWSLAFQWPAVNLALAAPYDTARLIAVPRTVTGSVVADSVVVQYSTPDSAVTVSATGLVTARFPTSGAHVVARVTGHGITLTDTAIVQVTTTPPVAPLAILSIQPKPDDHPNGGLLSANFNIDLTGNTFWIPFYATLTTGDTVCDAANGGCVNYPLFVHYATSDASIAEIDQYGYLTPKRPGRVTVTISTLAYGVPKVDSLHASIGTPSSLLTADTLDNNQHLYILDNDRPQALPWTVGFQLGFYNNTGGRLELSVPGPAHGVYFLGAKSMQLLDTLSQENSTFVYIQFDSVGTYTIRHRLLSTGETIDQTYSIESFP